ncbi:hypothetical protein RRG08_022099 [Elysia crispata]|uniref:Uncharacterized protein n=1 Tax=Elysia crispata TaxID=231223 RepID=A0AAE1CRL6_9GAST|nr:hypothetical protein RRG08_022099 [Elysia crispata]
MASVSKAQLVIISFFVCNCLHSIRSNDQSEPLDSSVGSLGLRSYNQQENPNPSVGSRDLRSYNQQETANPSVGSRDLRSYNQQETANPFVGSRDLRSYNQQENPNPSVTSLGLRSSNQQENPNPSVGSLGLRSSNQQENLNSSAGSLNLRTAKHQRQRESMNRSVLIFHHRKPSDAERSIGNLDDIKQHEMPKHFLEFFNQHKLTVASSGNANQPRLPQLSTNSLDLWNQHRALRLSTNSLSSPNSHEPSKFSRDSISPNFSRGRKIVCPKYCKCTYCQDRTMCTVDCSNMGLREIPELPEISTNVYLQNNHIKDVSSKKLKCLKNLKELDLSQNKLRRIRNNTFQGLDALVFLSLKENLLKYSSGTFELDAFQGLTSLKSLHLEGNQPNFSENFTYPEEALTRVPTLEYLWLDGFPRRLGPGFSSLRNISHLSFSSPETIASK